MATDNMGALGAIIAFVADGAVRSLIGLSNDPATAKALLRKWFGVKDEK